MEFAKPQHNEGNVSAEPCAADSQHSFPRQTIKRLRMSDQFYILSLDGGGFRGVFTARILQNIGKVLGVSWHDKFSMFAGTSTGSILAAGLACGHSADKLFGFYKEHGDDIFKRKFRSYFDPWNIFISKYTSKKLKSLLEKELGDITLGQIPVPLIIPSVDIGNGCVHLFKSQYDDNFIRDTNVRVSDVVLASCSAPTYFDPHIINNTNQLADGGLWANNPSLVAVIDAHFRLGISLDNIRVLSIGTGRRNICFPRKTSRWKDILMHSWQGWGFATRWKGSKLLDLILNLQNDTVQNMLCLLLNEGKDETEKVCKLTFDSDQPLPMDSTYKLNEWINRADYSFSHNADRIKRFLDIKGSKQ